MVFGDRAVIVWINFKIHDLSAINVSKDWKTQRERSSPLAIAIIRWIALKMGRPFARFLLYPITLYYLLFSPVQRRASFNYLKRVLGKTPNWFQIAKHIHCFAATILDRVYFLTGRVEQLDLQFPNKQLAVSYSSNGRGFVLLGSHIGSFEVLRGVAEKFPVPVKIMMDEEHNKMIVNVLNTLNPSLKDMVISLGQPDSLIRARDCLDAGEVVALLGDRVMDSEKTTTCYLLGEPIQVSTAPILLASVLKVPVIMFFGLYMGRNRYETHFELLSERVELKRNSRQQDIQRWTQMYVNSMERYLKRAPYNWFNFYDYWGDEIE